MLPEGVERGEIVSNEFDGQIRLYARDRFIDTHGHGLREVVGNPWDLREFPIQRSNQLRFRMEALPGIRRL